MLSPKARSRIIFSALGLFFESQAQERVRWTLGGGGQQHSPPNLPKRRDVLVETVRFPAPNEAASQGDLEKYDVSIRGILKKAS